MFQHKIFKNLVIVFIVALIPLKLCIFVDAAVSFYFVLEIGYICFASMPQYSTPYSSLCTAFGARPPQFFYYSFLLKRSSVF